MKGINGTRKAVADVRWWIFLSLLGGWYQKKIVILVGYEVLREEESGKRLVASG